MLQSNAAGSGRRTKGTEGTGGGHFDDGFWNSLHFSLYFCVWREIFIIKKKRLFKNYLALGKAEGENTNVKIQLDFKTKAVVVSQCEV